LAWLGLLCFTVQIYFDFSGYSDIAIGIGRMFGFRIMENFNQPYLSASFTEFWRRWHISLSTWIREYLYFPLGGNRVSTARSYLNLTICFLLSGLWHGASWTFIVWGLYQGVFLILDRAWWLEAQKRVPRLVSTALTFGLVMVGWVLFRSSSVSHAGGYLGALFGLARATPPFFYLRPDVRFSLIVGLALIFAPLAGAASKRLSGWTGALVRTDLRLVLASALLVLSLGRACSSSFNPFLYFRF
jgi:alginate O-acetyltransferase complex protein AlgI